MMQFDAASHTYTLGGKKLPNVTTILKPLSVYAGVPQSLLDAAAERGNNVHKACELLLWDLLDEETLADEYKPYMKGFKQFLSETGFEAQQIEERVYHKSLMYAGTMDMGGILPGRKPKRVIIDIKTTFALLDSVGPQTAAYQEAYNSHHEKPEHLVERFGLQLKANGTYKMLPFNTITDMTIFRSCLNIHNFMRKKP